MADNTSEFPQTLAPPENVQALHDEVNEIVRAADANSTIRGPSTDTPAGEVPLEEHVKNPYAGRNIVEDPELIGAAIRTVNDAFDPFADVMSKLKFHTGSEPGLEGADEESKKIMIQKREALELKRRIHQRAALEADSSEKNLSPEEKIKIRNHTLGQLEMLSLLIVQEGRLKYQQTDGQERAISGFALGDELNKLCIDKNALEDERYKEINYIPTDDEWKHMTELLRTVPAVRSDSSYGIHFNNFLITLHEFCRGYRKEEYNIQRIEEKGPIVNNHVTLVDIETHAPIIRALSDGNNNNALRKLYLAHKRKITDAEFNTQNLSPELADKSNLAAEGAHQGWVLVNTFLNPSINSID